MTKFDYFSLSMRHGAYRSKAWVISAFSVVITPPTATMSQRSYATDDERTVERLRLKRDPFGKAYYNDPETEAVVWLEDVEDNVPAFTFKTPVSLTAGMCENLTQSVETSYGAWLFNQIMLVYPFGAKIPYAAKGYTIPEIEKIVTARLADNLPEGAPPPEGSPTTQPIYVAEYILFNNAAGSLTGYTQLCVPAATPYTLTIDPAILKRRDELFEQYKDQLTDPAIQARIGDELIRMDKEWIAKDPDKGFYYRDKSFDVVRKALFLFQGSEVTFGQQGDFVKGSVDEGLKPETLPDLANSQRAGSFNRGSQTALGGVTTKFNLRMFQNAQVIPGDCGSTIGRFTILTAVTFPFYIGNYYLDRGKSIRITEDAAQQLIGKQLEIRSPTFCHAEGSAYCAVCVGDKIASTPDSLATYAGDVGSLFLSNFLKSVHGRALKTQTYDFRARLT